MKCSLGISDFFEEISSLSHSTVFLYFFDLFTYEGLLRSPCCSLEHCIQLGCLSLLLLFLSQLFVRLPQTTTLSSCIAFSWGCFWSLPPVWCHEPLSIILQTLCLSDLIPWNYESSSHFHCIVVRGWIEVIPEWSSGFPYFLQFKSDFGNTEFMIWATVSPQSCFCWLYRASPSLAAKNVINPISVLTVGGVHV